jgi:hypothetical protein
MKKILLSMAVVLITVFNANAQSYSIEWEGEALGDTVIFEGTPDEELTFHLVLTNNSADVDTVQLVRRLIDLSPTAAHNFCWGSCYEPNLDSIFAPRAYVRLEPGQTCGEFDFTAYYLPNGFIGTSMVEYTFYNKNDASENLTVVALYVTSPDAIDENIIKNTWMSDVYPNPATNFVTIDYKLPREVVNANAKIVNLLGSVVSEKEVSVQNSTMRMDVSDLNSGIYFYSLFVNGEVYSTKKLVIR